MVSRNDGSHLRNGVNIVQGTVTYGTSVATTGRPLPYGWLCRLAMLSLIVGFVFLCVTPIQANATTLAELSTQVQQAQDNAKQKEREYGDAKDALEGTVDAAYKGGNVSIINLITSPSDMQEMLSLVKYGNAMTRTAADKVSAAEKAKSDADNAVAAAQTLYDRKKSQEESLKNADSIHFCQASSPWGQMRYWNGTVATHGCGLVAYTVAIDILTGRNMAPSQMLSERGDWAGTEQTVDSTTGGHGRTHEAETLALFGVHTTALDTGGDRLATLDAALGDESVVQICAAGRAFKNNEGYWRWSNGHYILVYRRADDGGYMVQDSSWTDKGRAVHYSASEMRVMLSNTHSMVKYSN